ncbi:MAG: RluA family pseudouridine synthase [Candidatus Adiutrix sp.]|jgi:23S rRNA pseudouridine1911/1915/1917 synthase|nr:RluA family pseudouridine synthase [Candidatus Adiutrix sp.]
MMPDRLRLIFDPPVTAPETPGSWRSATTEPYLTGPLPAHLANLTATGLVARLTALTDSEAADLVAFGALWLDDRPCLQPGLGLAGFQRFRFNPPAYGPVKFYEAEAGRIVYEDDDLLVYNKESGRPSQAVPHDAHNNVLSAVGRMLTARGGQPPRLWLCHRLDADTSGLLLMARTREAAGLLGRAFQQGQVAKEYLALGLGPAPDQAPFQVEAHIAKEGRRYVARAGGPGRVARTDFQVLDRAGHPAGQGLEQVLFRAAPRTGRTHQVRLHLAWAGWPLAGDRFYGRPEIEAVWPSPRLMLASAGLSFTHPRTGRPLVIRLAGDQPQ